MTFPSRQFFVDQAVTEALADFFPETTRLCGIGFAARMAEGWASFDDSAFNRCVRRKYNDIYENAYPLDTSGIDMNYEDFPKGNGEIK